MSLFYRWAPTLFTINVFTPIFIIQEGHELEGLCRCIKNYSLKGVPSNEQYFAKAELIDEPTTKDHIIRDLKGIVFGKEYSNNDGKVIETDKPSIIKKVDYVKQNIVNLGVKYDFDSDLITEFEGLVITIDYPPISGFNEIKMLSINQISGL